MKKISLLFIVPVIMMACNQDSKTADEQDAEVVTNNYDQKPAEINDVPWAAVTDTSTQEISMVKSDLVIDNDLSPKNIIDALHRKYPEISMEWLKQSRDTAYVHIADANYLSRGSGSMGAKIFLAESTYSFTTIAGINYVNYHFKEGDHASPGTYQKSDFEFKDQNLNYNN